MNGSSFASIGVIGLSTRITVDGMGRILLRASYEAGA